MLVFILYILAGVVAAKLSLRFIVDEVDLDTDEGVDLMLLGLLSFMVIAFWPVVLVCGVLVASVRGKKWD